MGEILDDPNREAVGLEPAWVEGTGGSDNLGEAAPKAEAKAKTKAELLDEAEARGIPDADAMTKAELQEALGD